MSKIPKRETRSNPMGVPGANEKENTAKIEKDLWGRSFLGIENRDEVI